MFPGSSIIGFPPGQVIGGVTHLSDAVASQAQTDVTAAYTNLAAQPSVDKSGIDLGGLTLVAGAYRYTSSAQLTGTLTLDAQGNAAAVWVFQMGSALTTASGSRVVVINGGSPCNVFWQVGSSAVLGTTTAFAGNILALTDITLTTGHAAHGPHPLVFRHALGHAVGRGHLRLHHHRLGLHRMYGQPGVLAAGEPERRRARRPAHAHARRPCL